MSDKPPYHVKDVARLTGVTVRTLHHYDAIGLLPPSGRTSAGYRVYTDEDLARLQQIRIARELGLSLDDIARMLDDPSFDRVATLRAHRVELVARAARTDAMIHAIDRTISRLTEGGAMSADEMFDGFDPYEEEARQRWGHTDAYRESKRRTKGYSKEDWARYQAEAGELLHELAAKMEAGASPSDAEVLDLAEAHRLQIGRWFYPCDRAMHAALGEMYVADERFAAFYEKVAPGLAAFLSEAITRNAAR